jgi:hypothetical protein
MKTMKNKQSKVEKKNQFRCMVCNKMRLRGVFVAVKSGIYSKLGYTVKVCQSTECKLAAEAGKF